jgi:MFS transporter, DHA2 family, multidrug resistance protein
MTGSRSRGLALAVLALPALVVSLDLSVLLLALPEISADLGASATQQLWITDAYGFLVAGFLVTMGTLGDRIGRRRLLLIGAAAFAALSVLAALSTSPGMLIAARGLLGIAGATLMPSALALVSHVFPEPEERGRAIALVFSCIMIGGSLGPLVGGLLLEAFSWGSVFLVAVPVMLLLLVAGPAVLPEYRDPDAGRLDLLSVALSVAAILLVVLGLKTLADDGWRAAPVFALVAGVALGAVFVARQRRLADPLLDMGLFRIAAFSATLLFMVCGGIALGGVFLLVTQYLQLVEGLEPLQAGLLTLPGTVAMALAVNLGPVLSRRIRPADLMAAGVLIGAAGFLVLAFMDGGVAPVVVGLVVGLFGLGLPGGLGIGLVLGAAPPEKAGAASGASETSQELGIALGIATFGSLGIAVYHAALALPAGAPPAAVESLERAVSAAEGLGPALGERVLEASAEAWTTALNAGAAVAAAIFIGLAVLAQATLRSVPAAGG